MLLTFLLILVVLEASIDVETKMKNERSEMLWIAKLAGLLPQSQRCFSLERHL